MLLPRHDFKKGASEVATPIIDKIPKAIIANGKKTSNIAHLPIAIKIKHSSIQNTDSTNKDTF